MKTPAGNNSRYEQILAMQETPVFMTLPPLEGRGTYATIRTLLAVPTTTKNPVAAMAFLTYLLSFDGQCNVALWVGNPVSHAFTEYMLDYYRTPGVGDTIEYYLPKTVEFLEEIVDWYEELLLNIRPAAFADQTMMDIGESGISPYSRGETTDFDSCYREAVNKIALYQNE